MKRGDDAPDAAGDARHLHVIGRLHRHHVARLDLTQREQVIRLRCAVGDLDLVDGRPWIERCDPFPQLDGAVRLAVSERPVEKLVEVESHLHELAQRQWTHATLAHVVVDDVLPRRLHPFHFEAFDRHVVSRYFTLAVRLSSSSRCKSMLPPLTIATTGPTTPAVSARTAATLAA